MRSLRYICREMVSSTITGIISLLLYGQASTWFTIQLVFFVPFLSSSFGEMSFTASVSFWYLAYWKKS